MHTYALRLHPTQDLKKELLSFAQEQRLKACGIVTCVGSLQQAYLRLANQREPIAYQGKFEICSLVGTLSQYGCHLHMAISDTVGKTFGGHVVDGNLIYTTAEIVLIELTQYCFTRELDPETGYNELVIKE
jgi:predicted DNA-binding protein with PD1-like motif